MNRRRLLALAGAGLGGLASTAVATRDAWVPFDGQFRMGLAPVVPAGYRAADRAAVVEQLERRLPPLVDLHAERAPSEWQLVRGLADGAYDAVELGAVAGTIALQAGLVKPLVQPALDRGWTYEGRLLAAEDDPAPLGRRRIAVGDPLSTPARAALARGDVTPPPAHVRWHEYPPPDALGEAAVTLAASDEFHAPPDATVYRSYPVPVPALYVRAGVGDPDALRQRFADVEGGPRWFLDARALTVTDGDRSWLGDAPGWLADAHLTIRRDG